MPLNGNQGEVILADMNGDGILDLVTTLEGRSVEVLRGVGDGSFVLIGSYLAGASATGVETLDLDGDGDLDVVVGSESYQINVFMNDGTGALIDRVEIATPSGPAGLGTADLDHNGYPDLVVASGTSDTLIVLLNALGGVTPVLVSATHYELTGSRLTLTWTSGSPAMERATVYRQVRGEWVAQGTVFRANDRLTWTDVGVRPGETRTYQLGVWTEGREFFVGEVTVTIPDAPVFALAAAVHHRAREKFWCTPRSRRTRTRRCRCGMSPGAMSRNATSTTAPGGTSWTSAAAPVSPRECIWPDSSRAACTPRPGWL